eukprot:COSAG05_NODE_4182_length_1633_cov_12.504619_3_plen_57_part_01
MLDVEDIGGGFDAGLYIRRGNRTLDPHFQPHLTGAATQNSVCYNYQTGLLKENVTNR